MQEIETQGHHTCTMCGRRMHTIEHFARGMWLDDEVWAMAASEHDHACEYVHTRGWKRSVLYCVPTSPPKQTAWLTQSKRMTTVAMTQEAIDACGDMTVIDAEARGYIVRVAHVYEKRKMRKV